MSVRKKRFWSDEEKREICKQASQPSMSVARVARRYAVNANMIHKWLRDPRFAQQDDMSRDDDRSQDFLPVEIAAPRSTIPAADIAAPPMCSSTALSALRLDLTLSDGRRILVEGPTSLAAAISLVEGLGS